MNGSFPSSQPHGSQDFLQLVLPQQPTTLYQRKERSSVSINWVSGSMVLLVALFLVVASSSQTGDSLFSIARKVSRKCECLYPDFEVKVLEPKLNDHFNNRLTKDSCSGLQKVLIGVFGFWQFVPNSDQLEPYLSAQTSQGA